MTNMMLRCEKCGREAGLEMVNCPERPIGACPYELRQGSAIGRKYALGCLVVFGFAFVFAAVFIGAIAGWRWGAGAAVVLILLGMISAWAKQVTLFNSETGAMWQRVDVFDVELARTVIGPLEPCDFTLKPLRPLEIPASVAALQTDAATPLTDAVATMRASGSRSTTPDIPTPPSQDGVAVFTAALAGLIAQGAARVWRGGMGKRRFKLRAMRLVDEVTTTYLLRPGEEVGVTSGALEERIMERLIHWEAQPAHADWPQGAPIYELVYALYDKDVSSPGKWLVSFAVDEAARRGIGQVVKGQQAVEGSLPPRGAMEKLARLVERWMGRFEINPAYEDQMEEQREVVLDLIAQLEDVEADFVRTAREEAKRAIDAREQSSD